ncbi:MAG: hypothetical protein IKQ49_05620 [Eubacterium sp.]|nr:hypothetical protein [Eubacterium sp.]
MKKMMKKLAVVFCLVFVISALAACGSDSGSTSSSGSANTESSSGKTDIVTGTWKQVSDMDGTWIFTFGDGKAKLVGETTGFTGEGTYTLDEANGKLNVMIDGWTAPKDFTYTLNGNNLKLVSTYASYDLTKQ